VACKTDALLTMVAAWQFGVGGRCTVPNPVQFRLLPRTNAVREQLRAINLKPRIVSAFCIAQGAHQFGIVASAIH